MRRVIARKNEWSHLTLVPLSATGTGPSAIMRISMYGTLVGIEAPPPSRNLQVKPCAISGLGTDLTTQLEISNDVQTDAGLDIKYSITENPTADLTLNTDFAQVEVHEQQVNLTRFSLFFPEKREFFLEGRGISDFAPGVGGGGRRGGGTPTLFYSRQIGLQGGEAVPIIGEGSVRPPSSLRVLADGTASGWLTLRVIGRRHLSLDAFWALVLSVDRGGNRND